MTAPTTQQIAKDINVPGKAVTDTNVGKIAQAGMSMEDAKQQVRNVGADVAQQEAIKVEAVNRGQGKTIEMIDALQKNSTRFNVLAEMTGEKYADTGVVDTEANSEEIVAKLSEAIIENPEEFLQKFGKERTFIDAVIGFSLKKSKKP